MANCTFRGILRFAPLLWVLLAACLGPDANAQSLVDPASLGGDIPHNEPADLAAVRLLYWSLAIQASQLGILLWMAFANGKRAFV